MTLLISVLMIVDGLAEVDERSSHAKFAARQVKTGSLGEACPNSHPAPKSVMIDFLWREKEPSG